MWHDIEQNTDEWMQLRSGKVGGSSISKIMANYGKAFGEPAKALAVDIALEQLRGYIPDETYTNQHMIRGHVQEPLARKCYEETYFIHVSNGGFFDNGLTSCSPDGLVGDNGMIEIKSVIPSVHFKTLKKNRYDSAYKWQLLHNLKQADREWIDFVSYCDTFTEDMKLFVYRLYARDFKEEFDQLHIRLMEFSKLLDETKQIITQGKNLPKIDYVPVDNKSHSTINAQNFH